MFGCSTSASWKNIQSCTRRTTKFKLRAAQDGEGSKTYCFSSTGRKPNSEKRCTSKLVCVCIFICHSSTWRLLRYVDYVAPLGIQCGSKGLRGQTERPTHSNTKRLRVSADALWRNAHGLVTWFNKAMLPSSEHSETFLHFKCHLVLPKQSLCLKLS